MSNRRYTIPPKIGSEKFIKNLDLKQIMWIAAAAVTSFLAFVLFANVMGALGGAIFGLPVGLIFLPFAFVKLKGPDGKLISPDGELTLTQYIRYSIKIKRRNNEMPNMRSDRRFDDDIKVVNEDKNESDNDRTEQLKKKRNMLHGNLKVGDSN